MRKVFNNLLISTLFQSLSISTLRFIEYGEYKGNYYGTSLDSIRSVLAKNKVCLLDVQPHVSDTNLSSLSQCNLSMPQSLPSLIPVIATLCRCCPYLSRKKMSLFTGFLRPWLLTGLPKQVLNGHFGEAITSNFSLFEDFLSGLCVLGGGDQNLHKRTAYHWAPTKPWAWILLFQDHVQTVQPPFVTGSSVFVFA